ncbi:hypothetical protein T03_8351 [Trichinella britovi]|uniref:Uncharacterized protein n=1 Tax=Trichinella britovi TaxID=45882 RepID=A0A0V1AK73_TRIBR|nr:hypothetical protein T03_8351 [Trichinella britovi]
MYTRPPHPPPPIENCIPNRNSLQSNRIVYLPAILSTQTELYTCMAFPPPNRIEFPPATSFSTHRGLYIRPPFPLSQQNCIPACHSLHPNRIVYPTELPSTQTEL